MVSRIWLAWARGVMAINNRKVQPPASEAGGLISTPDGVHFHLKLLLPLKSETAMPQVR